MHGECASPIEFVVIIMLIKFVKLKILVYLVFFMNVKFLFTTFLESSMSIKIIVVLNMLVLHMPVHGYKFFICHKYFEHLRVACALYYALYERTAKSVV